MFVITCYAVPFFVGEKNKATLAGCRSKTSNKKRRKGDIATSLRVVVHIGSLHVLAYFTSFGVKRCLKFCTGL